MQDVLENPYAVLSLMREVADTEILPRFQRLDDADIMEKSPGDIVTAADHASEEAFKSALPGLLTGSTVIGEEGVEADPDLIKRIDEHDPVWIVDPVDGTFNFAHGKKPFTVIVALVLNGTTKAGWILDPLEQEAVWAVKGDGATHSTGNLERKLVPQSGFPALKASKVTAGAKLRQRLARAAEIEKLALPEISPRYRCVGREYMDIAIGKIDLARYGGRLKPWDHAAGCLIVREAGGTANVARTDLPYEPTSEISTDSIGVCRHAAIWGDFKRLVIRTDTISN